MAEKLDPRQVVTFEELLRAMMMEQDATRRVLVRKGLLTNEEVLEEIKAVRREMEVKRSGEGERRVSYQRKKAKGYPLCRGPFAFFSLT